MSQGKENMSTLMDSLRQEKAGVRRSDRTTIPSWRVREEDEGARGGRGRHGGQRGGRAGGGVDFEVEASEFPSASGDVASQLQLEPTDEAETEHRDEVESEAPEGEVEVASKKVRIRGEGKSPMRTRSLKLRRRKPSFGLTARNKCTNFVILNM